MAKISFNRWRVAFSVTKYSRLILQTFKFTIYSIIVHYKHRVQLIRIGRTKNFCRELANSLFCTPHYGTRGAAPETKAQILASGPFGLEK